MIDHDKNVGQMLDLLDELGIADNTFVMYSTDNGAEVLSWIPHSYHKVVGRRHKLRKYVAMNIAAGT